jgi:GPH family glycoside/pentoside/hexuronide:cation symporter
MLSQKQKIGFGLGDFANNLYWQSVSFFLLFFYTESIGLSAAEAGVIYLIASLFDGVTDPIIGLIADRTKGRFGKYRGYILFGALPLALSFIAMFFIPSVEGILLLTYVLLSHLFFRLAYTLVSVPYTSMSASMTHDSVERSSLAGYRMFFATLAGILVAFFMQPLVAHFDDFIEPQSGFLTVAILVAIFSTFLYPIVVCSVQDTNNYNDAQSGRLSNLQTFEALLRNKAFWIAAACVLISVTGTTILNKSILYYFKYVLNQEGAARYAMASMAAIGFVAIPIWLQLAKQFSKKFTWIASCYVILISIAVFWIYSVDTVLLMTIWLIAFHFGAIGISFTFWALLPDTVEYGEYVSGVRIESLLFGLAQFFLKAALGLGAGLFGWLLESIGFVSNTEQSIQVKSGLVLIMITGPAIFVISSLLLMTRYPNQHGSHEDILRKLTKIKS